MRHKVGQIIFVMLRKQRQVLPVLVVEETIKKRIDGETYTYIVQLPNSEETQISLEKLDADIFETIEDVKETMLRSAATTIEKIIISAKTLGTEYFAEHVESEPKDIVKLEESNIDTQKIDADNVKVDLGNGVKGSIDISNLKSHGVI